jgi:type IV pilus assembly protein PilY1
MRIYVQMVKRQLIPQIAVLTLYSAICTTHADPLNLPETHNKTDCISSVSPVTFNSTAWHTGSLLFQPSFDDAAQRGKLQAYPIHADGSLGKILWDTEHTLLTNTRPLSKIHSKPIYVGTPAFHYPDNLEAHPYTVFAQTHAKRTPVIYVSTNDGILHGFNATATADAGKTMLVYTPSPVHTNLDTGGESLNNDGSTQSYLAGGSLTIGDAYFEGAWHTLLVGSLGQNNQGIFTLDTTNPDLFSENHASQIVRWKFNDALDEDLGNIEGQPAIIRLANGAWAIAIGNGTQNTKTDQHISHTGNAIIYLLNAADGHLLHKFNTQIGAANDPRQQNRPNGITTLSPVDINADHVIDYIYAPDRFGNVWKLDVRSHNAADWRFAYGSTTSPKPLFTARSMTDQAQPITTAVAASMHPSSTGQMIYFGTGKYPEPTDTIQSNNTQTFYALWDRNTTDWINIERHHLLAQSILSKTNHASGINVRITSNHGIHWYIGATTPTNASTQGYLGWYMDLYDTKNQAMTHSSESVLVDPILHHGRIMFATASPSADPCGFNNANWLMMLDANSGSRLHLPTFDLNGDGLLTEQDNQPLQQSDDAVISGVQSTTGVLSSPTMLNKHQYAIRTKQRISTLTYLNGSSGKIQLIGQGQPTDHPERRSWRQIF